MNLVKLRRKLVKTFLYLIGGILCLLLCGYIILLQPSVQTKIVKQVASHLSEQLDAKITLSGVKIDFIKTLVLENLCIADPAQDTLLFAKKLKANIASLDIRNRKVSLNFFGLEDAYINLNKKSGEDQFNFKFLIAALSGGKNPIKFNIKKVGLQQIKFRLNNEARSLELSIDLERLNINLDKFIPSEKTIIADLIDINQAKVVINKPKYVPRKISDKAKAITDGTFMNKKWEFGVHQLNIATSSFEFDNYKTHKGEGYIDFNHLDIPLIDLIITEAVFNQDTIMGSIDQLAFTEKGGFKVNNVTTKGRITTNEVRADDLKIETSESHIERVFSMQYDSFKDFKNFTSQVTLFLEFNNSHISLGDMAHFVPALDKHSEDIRLDGIVRGKISKLKGKDLTIKAGEYTFYKGNINLSGLPQIKETYIDLKADQATTSARELASLIPGIKVTDQMLKLGHVSFTGRFTGFVNDFVANGIISSALGEFSSDINLKLAENPVESFFSGRLSAKRFELGTMLNMEHILGTISFDAKVYGNGFDINTITAKLNANIQQIDFKSYNYKNILMDGQLQQKLFAGNLFVNDDNLFLDFQGTVDFNGTKPLFDFTSHIKNGNLKELNLANEPYTLNADFYFNLQGSHVDSIEGTFAVANYEIENKGSKYALDTLSISSSLVNQKREIIINSEIVEAKILGNLQLSKLPTTISSYISNYFPYMFTLGTPSETTTPDDFTFQVKVLNTKNLTNFFLPELSNFNNAQISGDFNSGQQKLRLALSIPGLMYKKTDFRALSFTVESNEESLEIIAKIDNIAMSDSMETSDNSFSASINKDSITMHLISGADSSVNRFDIFAFIQNTKDVVNLSVLANEIILNNKNWDLPDDNNIKLTKDQIICKNFKLTHKNQILSLESKVLSDTTSQLLCNFKNLDIYDFTQLIRFSKHKYSGLLNGVATIKNPKTNPGIWANGRLTDLAINGDTIGNLFVDVETNDDNKTIDISANLGDLLKNINIAGSYHLNQPDSSLAFRMRVKKLNLSVFQEFLHPVFSNIHGTVTSNLKLTGSLKAPVLSGKAVITDGGTTVNYLKTHYTIPKATVIFKENKIVLRNLMLYDSLENVAIANGAFLHQYFKKVSLDVAVNTDNLLMLNTTEDDNKIYYGTAFGKGLINFNGLLKNLDIDMKLMTLKGTKIITPMLDETSVTKNSFVKFVNSSKQVSTSQPYNVNLKGLKVNIDLEITPDAHGQIIIDPDAGDAIRVNGYGNIKMSISTLGEFKMYGTFEIAHGDYIFTFYNKLINKQFDIEKGGTITWSGDPYEAIINVNALYKVRASSYDLIKSISEMTEEDKLIYKKRTPFHVKLLLTNSLFSPDIDFDILDVTSLSDHVHRKLLEIKQDKNELNKQVFGLLVLNRFIPTEIPGEQVWRSGVNTSVSEFISAQLSHWASQLSEDVELNVAYYGKTESGVQAEENPDLFKRRELQLALTKRFFDDRVSVDIGGNFNLANDYAKEAQNDASNIAGDFNIEYKITPSGNLRVKVFRKSDFDIILERNKSRTGVGIFYRREFDKLKELWEGKKGTKKSS